MGASMPPRNEVALDRELLETLFKQLDAELEKNDARARIYVVGGARMTLGLREGRTTRDVDVTFREAEGPVNQAVETVAERNDVAKDWLNTAAVKMLPTAPDAGERTRAWICPTERPKLVAPHARGYGCDG